jgi:ethanolamine ammonia-lyase small subunit
MADATPPLLPVSSADHEPADSALPARVAELRRATPARILAGRSGSSYRTNVWLGLRHDHAAALDAVHAELDVDRDFGELARQFKLFEVSTQARCKAEYLLRPDLGRRLSEPARQEILQRCLAGTDL